MTAMYEYTDQASVAIAFFFLQCMMQTAMENARKLVKVFAIYYCDRIMEMNHCVS